MIKKMSSLELLTLIIATIALLIAFLASSVNAENLPDLSLRKVKDMKPASTNNITSANSSLTKAEILKEKGVPGKGIDKAPGLQKPFNPHSQAGNHITTINEIQATSNNSTQITPNIVNGAGNNNQGDEYYKAYFENLVDIW